MTDTDTLQFRRGPAAQATANNYVLAAGEPGFEVDTGKEKRGDGIHTWTELPYIDDAAKAFASTAAGLRVQDRGAWSGPGTVYALNDQVTSGLVVYICAIAHTSGSTFSGAPNWSQRGVQSGAYAAMPGGVGTAITTLIWWTAAQAFTVTSATRNANEAITTASVVWPDGGTGTYTAVTLSTAFSGATDAYHVTYIVPGGATVLHTITQALVTRDINGAVTAQPALTIV